MKNEKDEKKERAKKKAEYEEGLKKTLIPLSFGVLAGIICFLLFVSTPYLVSVNGGLKAELDKGLIPDKLIDMFETKGTPLSETVTITKKGKYLFNIDASGLEENLNKGVISEELKVVLETKGFPLPENAIVRNGTVDEWEITTGEEIYIVKKRNEKLDIYESNDKWWINEEKYLFSTNVGLEEDLNNNLISKSLKNVFKTEGFPLSENSEKVALKKNEDKWAITDEEKKNTYFIRKEDEKLDIYTNFKSKDWLIIAILMVFVQKFVYRSLHIAMEGAKDWIYIAFMTVFCWFVAYTLLLDMYI
jgi:hypothetical protein